MTDLRARAWAVFDQLADVPAARREAALQAACGDDQALRAEVEKLLAVDARLTATEGDKGFLQSPVVRPPTPAPGGANEPAVTLSPGHPVTGPPSRVGHYRITRLLGEGGMGAVYEAEQDSPRRTVALKIIRPGLATPTLVRRFTHEAQILGRLHHPGIAQVYEAGLGDDGQPFFAMEFIRGLPLDEYARQARLDLGARVGLLAQVCDAVQHAHEQGVIHRDLKPANVLVDQTGQPKVVDFGVARATDADLLTGTGLTRTGQLLGTPNYMSPEQVAADPALIDRRSDVYALGVILFELAAHRLPYLLENQPLAEVARLILEEDPPRLGSLHPELRGDVEVIAAKALEKDPGRRYASAAELAADLRRWLAHEPILARPTSALYHLRKFARRHRGLVGGVLATGAALAVGLVVSTLFAVGEARQRGRAEQNALQALDKEHEALFQAYRARVAAAAAALSAHDVADAARQLDAAPAELRDWEWRHLHARLDDSSAVLPVPAPEGSFLTGAPDRLRVGTVSPAGLRLTDPEGGGDTTVPIGPGLGVPERATQTRRGLRVVAWLGDTAFHLLDEAGRVLCRGDLPEATERGGLAVSPDGRRVACVWAEGNRSRLGTFDAASGQRTALCGGGYLDGITAFTFSPDGTRLASASEERTARLWDPATGALLATCRGHTSKVLGVAFRPDGARLVTTSADGTVRQWDAATGREVESPYDRHTGEVAAAVYSPDGQWVASAGTDRTVRVWRATGRDDVAVLHGHTESVTELAFAPDGRRLASLSRERGLGGAGDGTVRTWEVDPRATLPVLHGHTSYVYPVAYSPDGRWIASGGWDSTVRLWDAATGAPCATWPHPGVVRTLAFGPGGAWLVSGTDGDERLRVWDVATGRIRGEIQRPAGICWSVVVSPDGRRVAATAFRPPGSFHLAVCDVGSGEPLFTAEGMVLAYSPDGRWLAAREADEKTVALRDARTHAVAARFRGHEAWVWSAAFSPDGRLLATCSTDRTVRVWQTDGGACRELRGHTDHVFAAAFHPGGTRLATGGRDRAVWLWDLARGEAVARLPGHSSYVWSLAFSPDGTTLASGSGDFTVRLWDTAPLKARYQARREAAALRPEAERLVEQLWQQKKNDPAAVVEALRADPALSEPLRQAALRAVLRRAQPPEAAPGQPPDRTGR
jgi:WD40 repeat protein/predicted Ser/Thr protein kinase